MSASLSSAGLAEFLDKKASDVLRFASLGTQNRRDVTYNRIKAGLLDECFLMSFAVRRVGDPHTCP